MLKSCLLVSLLWVLSCSSTWRPRSEPVVYPPALEKAAQELSRGQSKVALDQVAAYLRASENIQWHAQAYYLQGRIHQSLGHWGEAEQSYRSAMRLSSGEGNPVETRSLYQLSLLYEDSGRYADLVASLVDLQGRSQNLDTLTAEVEVPARLAAAYASQGHLVAARTQHGRAQKRYQTLLRQQRDELAANDRGRVEYYLGLAIFPAEADSFTRILEKLNLGQRYFLMSAESGTEPWAAKAEKTLVERWQMLWSLLEAPQLKKSLQSDPQAQQKIKQREQLELASDFYDLLLKFEEERSPGPQKPMARTLLQVARTYRTRLEKFAANLQIGPETIRREKIPNRPLSRAIEIGRPEAQKAPVGDSTEAVRPSSSQPRASKPASPEQIGQDPNL